MFKYLLQTALHWAAKHGKEDMTTVLAEAGADINTKAVSADIPQNLFVLSRMQMHICLHSNSFIFVSLFLSQHVSTPHPGRDGMRGLMFLTCVPSCQKVSVFKMSASDITPLKGCAGAQLCK